MFCAAAPRDCNSRDCSSATSVLSIAEWKYPTWSGLAWIATARVIVANSGLIAPVGADSAGGGGEAGTWERCPHAARDIGNTKDATAINKRMSGVQRAIAASRHSHERQNSGRYSFPQSRHCR